MIWECAVVPSANVYYMVKGSFRGGAFDIERVVMHDYHDGETELFLDELPSIIGTDVAESLPDGVGVSFSHRMKVAQEKRDADDAEYQ